VSETAALAVVFLLPIPLAAAGVALMNTGLGRSRSAAHALLSSLCAFALAALAYALTAPLFLGSHPFDGPNVPAACLGMLAAGLTAIIPLGAGADRWRLGATCVSAAILGGIVNPLFAHWIWGGGWLSQLGVHYGMGRGCLDTGGAASIHVAGGIAALSIAWVLGPRRGRYSGDGMPAAIPGHNAVLVLFACLLALMGWFGLNAAGAILFNSIPAERVALVFVNTTLSAAAAALVSAALTRARFGRPDPSLCANAWIGGLVTSSAGSAFMSPAVAALAGGVGGALVTLAVEWLDFHLEVDDPGGSISAHAVGGIWGLVALGFFGRLTQTGQSVAQLVGIATLLGLVLPVSYGWNWLLDRFYRQRISPEGELQGLDLYELGAGAYPEFVIHREDFYQR